MHKCVSGFVKSSIWSQLRRGRLSCPLLCWLKFHWKHNLKVGSFSWGICQMTKHKQDLAVSIHWSHKDSRGSMKLWNLFSLNNIWPGIFRFKLLQIFFVFRKTNKSCRSPMSKSYFKFIQLAKKRFHRGKSRRSTCCLHCLRNKSVDFKQVFNVPANSSQWLSAHQELGAPLKKHEKCWNTFKNGRT